MSCRSSSVRRRPSCGARIRISPPPHGVRKRFPLSQTIRSSADWAKARRWQESTIAMDGCSSWESVTTRTPRSILERAEYGSKEFVECSAPILVDGHMRRKGYRELGYDLEDFSAIGRNMDITAVRFGPDMSAIPTLCAATRCGSLPAAAVLQGKNHSPCVDVRLSR